MDFAEIPEKEKMFPQKMIFWNQLFFQFPTFNFEQLEKMFSIKTFFGNQIIFMFQLFPSWNKSIVFSKEFTKISREFQGFQGKKIV